MKTIGFIGLGHMGALMAQNLMNANYKVLGFDKAHEALKNFKEKGGHTANLQEIAEQAEVVFTSVQMGGQVTEICLGDQGIFEQAKKGLLYIDCSSIDITSTMLLHEEAEKYGVKMLDAPVSGGVAAAAKAALTFMVGGSDEAFAEAQPYLKTLGKKIIHAGPPGRGSAAKICNNLLLGISMVGVCEAFTLADKLGLSADKFFEISSNSSGQCWALTNYCPVPGLVENVPANNNYQPGFSAKMMLKDLKLSQHAAEATDATTPLGSVTTELYELFVNQGKGDLDFSGIIKLINNQL